MLILKHEDQVLGSHTPPLWQMLSFGSPKNHSPGFYWFLCRTTLYRLTSLDSGFPWLSYKCVSVTSFWHVVLKRIITGVSEKAFYSVLKVKKAYSWLTGYLLASTFSSNPQKYGTTVKSNYSKITKVEKNHRHLLNSIPDFINLLNQNWNSLTTHY